MKNETECGTSLRAFESGTRSAIERDRQAEAEGKMP